MNRVVPTADPSLPVGAARMTVHLAGGQWIEERVTAARGMPGNPLPRADLESKFRNLASAALPGDQIDRLLSILRNLPTLPNIATLASLAAGTNRDQS